jgi:biopolymer transport protein ExbB/TolQ
MLVNTAAIVEHRFYRYRQARKQSRAFVRDALSALREGDFREVTKIAKRNRLSHVASVVAAGLAAFASAPPHFTDGEAIQTAEGAFQRRRQMLAAELRLGLGTLTTIASTAPFIGLLGTVFGILGAFKGVGMARATLIAMAESTLALALVTTAAGLAVAIPAACCRNHFCDRLEVFESEMSNAALEAVSYLAAHPQWRSQPGHSADQLFAARRGSRSSSWEVPYDHQRALLLSAGFCGLYIIFLLARGIYGSYIWQRNYAQASYKWEYVQGRQLVSPDHRYRAVVPAFVRWAPDYPGKTGNRQWSCQTPEVALRIVPNDRPLAWKPHLCGEETRYALEPDEALLTWGCSVPVIQWRTNDNLLVQCSDCSSDNLQLLELDLFSRRITVLGQDGKHIDPQVVHPEPQCYDQ